MPGLFETSSRVCGVCTRQYAKYKCPRCAVAYCCLACYRSHSEGCAEGFYEEEATRVLRETRATPEQRSEMLQTLRRFEGEYGDGRALGGGGGGGIPDDGEGSEDDGLDAVASGDEEGELDEPARMALVQLLSAASLQGEGEGEGDPAGGPLLDEASLLSEAGRATFRRLVADGSLAARLQAAPAWWERVPPAAVVGSVAGGWCVAAPAPRVVDVTDEAAAEAPGAPPLPATIPPLRSLTSRAVPAGLRYSLLEQLVGYAYVYRLHCGAPEDDPLSAGAALLALCATLSGSVPGVHPTASEALLRLALSADDPAVATSPAFGARAVADAETLLGDPAGGRAAMALAGLDELLRALGEPERRVVSEALRFELRKELERREALRVAAAGPQTAAATLIRPVGDS
ncbi:hypothetical protein EMIHUDRAFT_209923 [Emiliania huxleyi CCMP1516]|uniref:HIT-type domain-containing protein n=2 Tax=Emiliania huxleyi TaxID=2903 RepID=A0A0D3J305_EMIH1|nr:hypothetical protein EMIHUDRAFT_209923 [Emiliania huxleyi CCMP1516]EOD17890.1 hypothetical protein EMIHUDRAFT_209923 [Emiliania huxleyi CCMP1516]|eukprot:XP_005770319.1 hypothetical protein EMIHUDRAFT_209923 [Emiliania huxleyi CCMP1516]